MSSYFDAKDTILQFLMSNMRVNAVTYTHFYVVYVPGSRAKFQLQHIAWKHTVSTNLRNFVQFLSFSHQTLTIN